MKYEPGLLATASRYHDFFAVVAKRKMLVVAITLSAAIIALIAAFLVTPTYRAEAKILPPQFRNFDSYSQISTLGGASQDMLRAMATASAANYLYIGLLQSRAILDRIVDKFDLMQVYDLSYREDARNKLIEALGTTSSKHGILSITVDASDPKMAADMANAFIEELSELTKRIAVTEASRRRLFFEQELDQVKGKLLLAEESMREFQENTGAMRIEDQAEAVIESFSHMRAKIAAKEVDLRVMRTYTTPRHPDFQRVEEEIKGMKEQLNMLEQSGEQKPDPFVPTGRIPSIETAYLRKLRELKYYETLLELIGRQYEIARVDEARESLLIQVLDKSVPPERRIKPNRLFMIVGSVCVGLVVSLAVVFLAEYRDLLRSRGSSRPLR
jgi:uncharacterized protein involved in exopolysaccharide biosynthesis